MPLEIEIEEGKWRRGKVLRGAPDGGVILIFDRKEGPIPYIPPGSELKVLWHDKGKLYEGVVKVKGGGGRFIPFLEVAPPEGINPIERRRYRRVKALLPVEYRKVGEGAFKVSNTIDISGCGVKMPVDEEIDVGDELEVLIYLPESDVVSSLGRVVRIEDEGGGRTAGIDLVVMDERSRKNIVNFVFKREREEKQKIG
ncbi:MAG: PilZ domain-containing protein [Synergistetes bacterium]|nr:PilZ domain-containing protein [Synergistota bacterium]